MIAHVSRPVVTLNLIYEDIKYSVILARTSATSYALVLNNSFIEINLHVLSDGGRLIRYSNTSHVTYVKEEIDRYWITVDGQSAVFVKENDPTVLRATSAGKIIRFLVEDGAFVKAKEMFAEIEVMKMVLPLSTALAGHIQITQVWFHLRFLFLITIIYVVVLLKLINSIVY